MKSWVTSPKLPPAGKVRVAKLTHLWYLLVPTKNPGERAVISFDNWQDAFQAAMAIQDERNNPS